MKNKGKKLWDRTRNEYLKLYPPNFEGYHICSVCGKWVTQIDLDHIKKRGSHPELISDFTNLRKICRQCHIKIT
jgi:5-methylcytosine-specific restriction endonuclease McrA